MEKRILLISFLLRISLGLLMSLAPKSNATTLEDAINKYHPEGRKRLLPYFEKAKLSYPPQEVTLIGLKEERKLELWARNGEKWVFIRDYPFTAASGMAGPKMRQGDMQVPEGIYSIPVLNPNSHYHLSMKVNYPNEFDLKKAKEEKRSDLGGDIFIHGDSVSIGCIAIGDEAIEELFSLVAKIGRQKAKVIIAPRDLRVLRNPLDTKYRPKWLEELYDSIRKALEPYHKTRARTPRID